MTRPRFFFPLLCLAGWFLLSGCLPESPGALRTPVPCQAAGLVAPEPITGTGAFSQPIIDTLRPTFEWLPTAYACEIRGYLVSVTAADGTTIGMQVNDGTSWAMDVNLEAATEYTWDVAAVALDGSVGPASPPFSFFTGPACETEQAWTMSLDTPAPGAVVSVPDPLLDWSRPPASCVPRDYLVTVQAQPAGTIVLQRNSGPRTLFGAGDPFLADCSLYHWWVQPFFGSVLAEAHSTAYFVTNFTGSCPGAPCDASRLVAPVPLSPAEGAAWAGAFPVLAWDYALPACLPQIVFHVQVARDPAFDRLVVYSDDLPGGWTSFAPAAVQLDDCADYYWRVAADADGTLGPYSGLHSFHTDFTGTCRGSSCDVAALPAPMPLTPADGTNWAGNSPFITWNYAYPACRDSVTFHVEVALDERFANIVVSGDLPGRVDFFDPPATQFSDCTPYYWRVAAETIHGRGPYSETIRFRTNFTACGRASPGTVTEAAACRSGPSQDYPVQAYLDPDTYITTIGRNLGGDWLVISRPDGHGECWVSASLVTLHGNGMGLTVRDTPPYTGPICWIYTEEPPCWQAGCRWVRQYDQPEPWVCVP